MIAASAGSSKTVPVERSRAARKGTCATSCGRSRPAKPSPRGRRPKAGPQSVPLKSPSSQAFRGAFDQLRDVNAGDWAVAQLPANIVLASAIPPDRSSCAIASFRNEGNRELDALADLRRRASRSCPPAASRPAIRRSELAALRIEDPRWSKRGLLLRIARSKTDHRLP